MPDPLHPAVVHLPIALAVLIPGLALLAFLLIRSGVLAPRTWAAVLLLQAILLGSGWMALETGEQEEERVEPVVAERHIEAHEEAAERFLGVAAVALLVLGAGLLPGTSGTLGRLAGVVVTAGVLMAGVAVGHTGGELVYRHGAGAAYVHADPGAIASGTAPISYGRARHHDDDDD